MGTIQNYLDNMFMGLPDTPQVRRAREELLAMMEDKYQELKESGKTENEAIGIVISEFGNLEELAQTLGISGYMSREDTGEGTNQHYVTMEDAREFLEVSFRQGARIGVGVMFCILSPVFLIVLGGAAKTGGLGVSEQTAGGLGLMMLLIFVAIGVGILVMSGISYQKYEDWKKEELFLELGAENYVREEKADFQSSFAVLITLGVVLCVLSVVPVCIAELFGPATEFAEGISVGILLFLVSIGVLLFIIAGVRKSSYDVLLQEGDYAPEKADKVTEAVSSIYWCLVTFIYLGWSFLKMNWHISWVIWPLAGCLFAAITGVIQAVNQRPRCK